MQKKTNKMMMMIKSFCCKLKKPKYYNGHSGFDSCDTKKEKQKPAASKNDLSEAIQNLK